MAIGGVVYPHGVEPDFRRQSFGCELKIILRTACAGDTPITVELGSAVGAKILAFSSIGQKQEYYDNQITYISHAAKVRTKSIPIRN